VVGEPGLNPLAKALFAMSGDTVNAQEPGPEGYVIRVTDSTVVIAGSDRIGTFWAAQTLAQMIRGDGNGRFHIAGGVIKDRPVMAFRGVLLHAAKDTLDFQTKLIKEILSPFKINYVILQMDMYEWQSHPEVVHPTDHVSREDILKLISLARSTTLRTFPWCSRLAI
jgi:N-acetyl-beta-hexosaminidase